MATSRAPSSVPPNQAAKNDRGFASTMVEAWQDANGAVSKMNWARTHSLRAYHRPQPKPTGLGQQHANAVQVRFEPRFELTESGQLSYAFRVALSMRS